MDMVEQAKAGHPGAPMGMAEIAAVLWRHHLRHNPANPLWPDRDRFVLSNGHASALLYALLHLTGYDLPMAELRRFRQLHSRTPGHPEYGVTPGVETTTGPLGQGFANAVGMAIAERTLAAQFNRPGHNIVDHRSFVFLGDGCLMEGISHEAASLAGRLGLGKLIACYDDNGISIDGRVTGWFSDDTPRRFEAYGWQVLRDIDGHDPAADRCRPAQRPGADRPPQPALLPHHHRPRRPDQSRAPGHARRPARRRRKFAAPAKPCAGPYQPFDIPDDVAAAWDHRGGGGGRGGGMAGAVRPLPGGLPGRSPPNFPAASPAGFAPNSPRPPHWPAPRSRTRKSRHVNPAQIALTAFAPAAPELLGGSADLTHSNLTFCAGSGAAHRKPGRQPDFLRSAGVRHGGDRQRHRFAWRLHPLRRHLPGVQRLRPQRHPHERADAPTGDLRHDP